MSVYRDLGVSADTEFSTSTGLINEYQPAA